MDLVEVRSARKYVRS